MDKSKKQPSKANKRLQYSQESMVAAVEDVKSGMPIARAAKIHGVPRITLNDKVKGRVPLNKKCGPQTVLTENEENLLVKWMFHVADCGFPITKSQLIDSVQILIKNLNRENCFQDGRPGRHWYEAFLKRHPQISQRVSQNLTSSRASVTENRIKQWFEEIETYLRHTQNFNVTEHPNRVFNCDETAFYLNPKEDKVLVKRGEKAVYNFVSNDEKECLTTLLTCSAAGDIAPPMIVYSYKRLPRNIIEKMPIDWGVGRSDNGWMTGETFFEYVANIFYPWVVSNKIEFPIMLFLDGHKSHLTMALSNFCSEKGIILIALCPNSTHILQPLDVAVFRPLKLEWKKSVRSWRLNNNGQRMGRDNFALVLQNALTKMKNFPDIIQNGFRACGLLPFNPENIQFSKYFKNSGKIIPEYNETVSQEDLNLLKLLETEIVDKLDIFRKSGEIWKGNSEDKSLFELWWKVKNRTTENVSENSSGVLAKDDSNLLNEHNIDDEALYIIPDLIESENLCFPITLHVSDQINVDDTRQHNENTDRDLEAELEIFDSNNSPGFLKSPTVQVQAESSSPKSITTDQINDDDTRQHFEHTDRDLEVELDIDILDCNNSPENIPVALKTPIEKPIVQVQTENNLSESVTCNYYTPPLSSPLASSSKENIPTPFKKSLFWPSTKTPVLKTKLKEKVPSVATSKQWQDYFRKKEKIKNAEMERKLKNQEERKRRQTEKEEQKKKKITTSKAKLNTEQSNTLNSEKIDTETLTEEEDQNNETEANPVIKENSMADTSKMKEDKTTRAANDKNENKKPRDPTYKINDFVIVHYNETPYPGIIVGMNFEKNCYIYEVNHMEKNGLNWIWPNTKRYTVV